MSNSMMLPSIVFLALLYSGLQEPAVLWGISFAEEPGAIYVPAREIGSELGVPVDWDSRINQAFLNGVGLNMKQTRMSPDGTLLVHQGTIRGAGLHLSPNAAFGSWTAASSKATVFIRVGPKRVEVDKAAMELRAYQGERLVMSSRVGVGREGYSTPNGEFTAGPYKARMHRSSIYDNAPMPWSVQVNGNIFVHGWAGEVGGRQSHGCIRLPVDGMNPAKFFYEWVDIGTPVVVSGEWRE